MLCKKTILLAGALAMAMSGCTTHPAGERAERDAAIKAGEPYAAQPESRVIPSLPDNPTADDIVRYAWLTNGDVEKKYWEWRAAIEQIPQDGTQPSNLVVYAGVPITNGTAAFNRTTVTIANDPMADIVWPDKLGVAAQRALEAARAAGVRFQKSKYELRGKILTAYYDYALTAELIRLEEKNARLLQTIITFTESKGRAGAANPQDLVKAGNELELSRNDIANLRSQMPRHQATLNALMNRPPESPLAPPAEVPAVQPVRRTDAELLDLVARQNPELQALAIEARRNEQGIRLARLQYYPDFSISASTDLAGVAQNLASSVTVPLLRYQAINAGIAQAQANLRATDATRRQTASDLAAQVVLNITDLRDADRQLELLEHVIRPRAIRMVTLARNTYASAQASLLDILGNERSLIAIDRLAAQFRVARAKRLADVEVLSGAALVPFPETPAHSQ